MFNIGDKINYSWYHNIEIVCKDEKYYVVKNQYDDERKLLLKESVDKYGKHIDKEE